MRRLNPRRTKQQKDGVIMAIREEVFGYFIPSVTLIGIGAAKEIPGKIRALGGTKPLIVTDKGITGAGITKEITDLLERKEMQYVVFDETIPNPTDTNVHDGVDVYKKEGLRQPHHPWWRQRP